jgi:cytochrome c-type biogenesis protein CcmE
MSRIDDELEQAVRDAEAGADKSAAKQGGERPAVAASSASVQAGAASTGKAARSRSSFIAKGGNQGLQEPEERKGSWKLLAALGGLMGIVLTLVFTGGSEAVAYSYKVTEVKAKAADLGERQLRVQGTLVPGSLAKQDSPCEHTFMIRDTGVKTGEALSVLYPQCVVPDTFREVKGVDVEVTAEGRLAADGHLQATKIFAKCPSKYEMRDSAGKMGGAPEHGGGSAKTEVVGGVETAAIR